MESTKNKQKKALHPSAKLSIHLVEDDLVYAELVGFHLSENVSCTIEKFSSGKDFLDNLYRNPSLVILDFALPDMKGDEMFKKVKEFNPAIEVIFLTATTDVNKVVELIKLGAYDYILKDGNAQSLLLADVIKIKETLTLKNSVQTLNDLLKDNYNSSEAFIGNNEDIRKAFETALKIAKTEIPVTISGEFGTGKEHLAKIIHFNSNRASNPFLSFNLESVKPENIRKELFGEEVISEGKSFHQYGFLTKAQGGTLVISEPRLMPVEVQAELINVLKSGDYSMINGNEKMPLDVRFVITSKNTLTDDVNAQLLLKDFYYRFSGVQITLPPLRARKSDVLLLAKNFTNEITKNNNHSPLSFSEDAKAKLMNYSYPGNIHELRNCIELAYAISDKQTLRDADITFNPVDLQTDLLIEEKTLDQYTTTIIKFFLTKYNEDVNLVSEKLDIGRSTIYKMYKDGKL